MRKKIVICGNYGANNLGDDLILHAFIQRFSSFSITVISADSVETARRYGIRAVPMLPCGVRSFFRVFFCKKERANFLLTKEAIREADLFILGGGTLLTDDPWQAMWLWGCHTQFALRYSPKVQILANGIGPFKHRWARRWAASILHRVDLVSVRDRQSWEEVKSLGRSDLELGQDPVLEMAFLNNLKAYEKMKDYVVFVPRYCSKNTNKIKNEFVKFINFLTLEIGKKVIFISFENSKKEIDFLNKIFEQCHGDIEIVKYEADEQKVLKIIANADLVVGMRLHSLILAKRFGIPFMGIAYLQKIKSFAADLGRSEVICDLDEVNAEILLAVYKSALKAR
ncbi:MAG: hypothetical protein UT55_C0001G0012 [Candidatus Peregrinibacteria bacterium GW2011_GWE2_39_6]|nr:MAG: hypothetical protein UT55_C0001G0012 [Candidatus Peregrinibacteria bacterium GW2011_GWE2_39_6]